MCIMITSIPRALLVVTCTENCLSATPGELLILCAFHAHTAISNCTEYSRCQHLLTKCWISRPQMLMTTDDDEVLILMLLTDMSRRSSMLGDLSTSPLEAFFREAPAKAHSVIQTAPSMTAADTPRSVQNISRRGTVNGSAEEEGMGKPIPSSRKQTLVSRAKTDNSLATAGSSPSALEISSADPDPASMGLGFVTAAAESTRSSKSWRDDSVNGAVEEVQRSLISSRSSVRDAVALLEMEVDAAVSRYAMFNSTLLV